MTEPAAVTPDEATAPADSDPQGDQVAATIPGLVRRIRRTADLSQRDLAARLGVGRATVARWETGETVPRVDELAAAARLAGLRVALLDGADLEVMPMRSDAVLDRIGRHYPAHLDPVGSDWWTPWSSLDAAYATAWRRARAAGIAAVSYQRRIRRDRWRWGWPAPPDQPTWDEVVAQVRARDRRRDTASTGSERGLAWPP
jgi:transcriptional regulator with XRE-family HTH domain